MGGGGTTKKEEIWSVLGGVASNHSGRNEDMIKRIISPTLGNPDKSACVKGKSTSLGFPGIAKAWRTVLRGKEVKNPGGGKGGRGGVPRNKGVWEGCGAWWIPLLYQKFPTTVIRPHVEP